MPDLEEAEAQAARHAGIENHPHGALLIRLIRQVRLITNRLPIMSDQVKALEERVKALEDRPPG